MASDPAEAATTAGGPWKLWVIELNPFMETTDGCLFSWKHERHILEGTANPDDSTAAQTEACDRNPYSTQLMLS